jgi:hypothetical protein
LMNMASNFPCVREVTNKFLCNNVLLYHSYPLHIILSYSEEGK